MHSAYGLMCIESVLAFQCLEYPSPSLFKEADSVISIQDIESFPGHNWQSAGGVWVLETRKLKCRER